MMPNDPLVGGVALRRPAIQSPNFVTGSTGWTINADGSVEFNSGVFRGTITAGTFQGTNFVINSSGAFFYSGTPALGNLIVSIASAAGSDSFGNAYPEGINVTTGTISGSTISGSVILGTNFIVNGFGAFFYSGTPALGNLIASISNNLAPGGTDGFGNPYYLGVCTYAYGGGSLIAVCQMANGKFVIGTPGQMNGTGGASPGGSFLAAAGEVTETSGLANSTDNPGELTLFSASAGGPGIPLSRFLGALQVVTNSDPTSFGTSPILFTPAGTSSAFLAFLDGSGGAKWQVGANTFFSTSTQQFTSTGDVAVTGLRAPNLGPGTYRLLLRIWYAPSGTIGSNHQHKWAFTGSGSIHQNAVCWQSTATSTATDHSMVQNNSTFPGLIISSPTHANFAAFMECDAILTVTATGTLTTTVNLTTGGDDITIAPGSYLEVTPLP